MPWKREKIVHHQTWRRARLILSTSALDGRGRYLFICSFEIDIGWHPADNRFLGAQYDDV